MLGNSRAFALLGGPLGSVEFDTQHHHEPNGTPYNFTTVTNATLLQDGLGAPSTANAITICVKSVGLLWSVK